VRLEATVRFPWAGGCHPWLDVLVETPDALIGVESKRYEPFRSKATAAALSDAFWRPVWGEGMTGFARVRDGLRDGACGFRHLDAAQLIKHAFGLRTSANRLGKVPMIRPVLLYIHAEPDRWPDGRTVPPVDIEAHRREVREFSELVAGDEVTFRATTYCDLLRDWEASPIEAVRAHVISVRERFDLRSSDGVILSQQDP